MLNAHKGLKIIKNTFTKCGKTPIATSISQSILAFNILISMPCGDILDRCLKYQALIVLFCVDNHQI